MQVWLFWLKYCNPLYYAFESVMANEFGDLDYACSNSDLTPHGASYNSIASQVCAVPGALPGQAYVSGSAYLEGQYGFRVSNLWRNVGINAAFFVFFALCTAFGMERYKLPAGRLATVFYKTEPRAGVSERSSLASDSEKSGMDDDVPPVARVAVKAQAVSSHDGRTLAWKNIGLELKVHDETKRLLDDLSELIELFDHLVLLMRGGRLAYDGPLGENYSAALAYFARSGTPCGEDENPAEYFLHIIGAGSRNTAKDDWAAIWKASNERAGREAQLDKLTSAPLQARVPLHAEGMQADPLHFQLITVMQRMWLYYWREPDYFISKLMMNAGNALLNGLTFNSPNNQRGAYNRVFSAFMSLIVCFVLSAIVIELPYAIIPSLVYWLLWYFPVGYFTEPSRSGYSFLMYELFSIFAHSLAQLCASLMPSLNATFMDNGFFFMFCNTFAGTLSPEPSTPAGWRWYYNVSPLFYLGEGVTVNALYDFQISCSASETSLFQPPNGTTCAQYAGDFLRTATGYILNPDATFDCQYCRYKNGQSYYIQYGYDFAHRHRNVGIFIGFIAFNYTAVIVLTYLTKVKTWRRR
ncbi:hypothetical protein SLS56_001187 [Neofusicoccum ribis]|uniref:ABC transporter n=1 Tax=Neofusicoccum ribis TaxID=45134 RepID=A0ABR3TAQ9_9PEZI